MLPYEVHVMGSSSEDDGHLVVKEENMEDEVMDDDMDSWDDTPRRSAFSPYRPVTVLTNLQRGNIQTQTSQAEPDDFTLHNRAAMGELSAQDLRDVEVDEVDSHGFTSLMWACHYGQLPTARLLLQHRAKVNMEGEDGETALLLAASNGHHEIVKLLISCGGDPSHTDHMGNTSLMYAAHGGHSHTAHELLEHGADPTATNLSGATAFSIAVNRGSKQVQLILERSLLKLLEGS
ncbi:ankyrin repeat family A protein 2-like isoform X1 [Portunus trituberculatus]|nr:ankyrin repeat family A protein 2-like isoform X1 [Portunus trituberculatus]XP_045130242.1 ankyrin repeat family A protein 2-like isoform X1 [Portunus trituberculatus]